MPAYTRTTQSLKQTHYFLRKRTSLALTGTLGVKFDSTGVPLYFFFIQEVMILVYCQLLSCINAGKVINTVIFIGDMTQKLVGFKFDPNRITRDWPVYERDTLLVIYIVSRKLDMNMT